MLSEKLTNAMSEQVNAEYYSAYLYLAMSAAADRIGLKGAANWLFVQAQEELAHGTHMYRYILLRDATPSFSSIAQPREMFADINEIFTEALSHEQSITKRINSLAALAMQESDHACYQFLGWYVREQVEEEASATEVLDKLRLMGDGQGPLLVLDNELGARVFADPFPDGIV